MFGYLEDFFSVVQPTGLREVDALGDHIAGGHVASERARHDDQKLPGVLHGSSDGDAVLEQPVGRHHAAVGRQPCVVVASLGHGARQQSLHGRAEPVALAGRHAVPHLVRARVQVLDPRQPVRILVPAAGREHHAHVDGGHGHAHHGAQRLEHRHRVVGQHLQVPWVFSERGRLGGREPIALRPRVDRPGQHAYVILFFQHLFPVERLYVFRLDRRGAHLGRRGRVTAASSADATAASTTAVWLLLFFKPHGDGVTCHPVIST